MTTNWDAQPVVLDFKDVCDIMAISHVTCRKMIDREDFPKIKVGRLYRIPRDEFRKWLEKTAMVN